MMRGVLGVGVLVFLGGACIGCSSESGVDPHQRLDFQVFGDLGAAPDAGGACGPTTYPCGPFGTQQGDIVEDLQFLGFMDPKDFCIEHKTKVLDGDQVARLAFGSWFKDPDACPTQKRRLLWVNVAAGWCGPCREEARQIRDEMAAGAFDERVGYVNILFEDADSRPADLNYLKVWISQLKLNFPVVADPDFRMGRYFNKAATPFNMLVDTSTMEIIYRSVGADLVGLGRKMDEFLRNLK